jgi:uncharacterized protein (DUF697 family)
MAFPISVGSVFGLMKEVTSLKDRPLLVEGVLADELARQLAAGGDPRAVRRGGEPKHVEALVLAIGDAVTEADEELLKRAHRKRVPIVVVAAGREAPDRVPFVLATDVVRAEPGHGFPLDAIADALAAKLGENATSLARRLPVLRKAVVEQLIASFSRRAGLVGAAVFIPGADLPVLVLNQLRLVLRICAAYGLPIDRERAPEILATVGAGFGFRRLAHELLDALPISGWLVKGSVAYTGTRALGEAAVRYCDARVASAGRSALTPRS